MIGFQVVYELLSVDRAESYLSFLQILDAKSPYMHYSAGERTMSLQGMRSRLRKCDVQGNSFVVVALGMDNSIIGYFAVNGGNSQATCHSSTIAVGVLPSYQRSGIASALLLRAENIAIVRGVSRFECTVVSQNEKAIRWYAARGFDLLAVFHNRYRLPSGLLTSEYAYEKILVD
jgi:ribosomal protein S18 acetylase RimI-like enzyme